MRGPLAESIAEQREQLLVAETVVGEAVRSHAHTDSFTSIRLILSGQPYALLNRVQAARLSGLLNSPPRFESSSTACKRTAGRNAVTGKSAASRRR